MKEPSRTPSKALFLFADRAPYLAAIALSLWLLAFLSVVLVDFLNVHSLQYKVIEYADLTLPFVWYQLFREAGPIEKLQWFMLLTNALVGAHIFVMSMRRNNTRYQIAAITLTFTLAIMLLEDSMNVRHSMARSFVRPFADSVNADPSTYVTLWEVFFYLLLAAGMSIPVLIFLFDKLLRLKTLLVLFLSYSIYGLAGFGSALRTLFDWQERLGVYLIELSNVADSPAWSMSISMYGLTESTESFFSLGYAFVDIFVEESLELIGASLLVFAMCYVKNDVVGKLSGCDDEASARI